VGCDERFIHLDGSQPMAVISPAYLGILLQQSTGRQILGLNRDARFVKPDSLNASLQYDYNSQSGKAPPPGAEGADQGNGVRSIRRHHRQIQIEPLLRKTHFPL